VSLAKAAGFDSAERRAPMQCADGDERHPDVAGIPILFVEAKHEKRCSPQAYAREYLYEERPGYVNVVAWRANGMGPDKTIGELLLTDLFKLVRELTNLREENIRLRARACPSAPAHWQDENGSFDVPAGDGRREWDCGPCRHQADGECALDLPVPEAGCSEFTPSDDGKERAA
jgi:hypothetical protein